MFIDIDRYRYSASSPYYTAWRGPKPDAISDRYPACEEFFEEFKDKLIFGEGPTAQKAYIDLCHKLEVKGISDPITDGPTVSGVLCIFVDNKEIYKIGTLEYDTWIRAGRVLLHKPTLRIVRDK